MLIDPRDYSIESQNIKLIDRFRVLHEISRSIKLGRKSPSSDSSTQFYAYFYDRINKLDKESHIAGKELVLQALGIEDRVLHLKSISPELTYKSEEAAKYIFKHIKEGILSSEEINHYLGYYNFASVHAADSGNEGYDIWDAQPQYSVSGGDGGNGGGAGGCEPSYHAQKLLGYGIKLKFLFIVEFKWQPSFQAFQSDVGFVVKNATRPNITAEYEDINMYNFRTRVPKRTIYEAMSLRFYDDGNNEAMKMWDAYQKALIPISNTGAPDENSSMAFSSGLSYGAGVSGYAASYGVPPDGTTKDILSQINVFHVYDYGKKMNQYSFHNPRISSLVLDDISMIESDSTEVEIKFTYDALETITGMGINGIGSVEALGSYAGSGGESSFIDNSTAVNPVSVGGVSGGGGNPLSGLGDLGGSLMGIGGAVGNLGESIAGLTGGSNPFGGRTNAITRAGQKITNVSNQIQGTVNQVNNVINNTVRTVNTIKNAPRVISSQIKGIRTEATRAAKSILNI